MNSYLHVRSLALWPASICVACYTHGPDTDAKKHVVYSFFLSSFTRLGDRPGSALTRGAVARGGVLLAAHGGIQL